MKQPSKLVNALSGAVVALAVGALIRMGAVAGPFPLRLLVSALIGLALFPLVVAALSRFR